MPRFTRPLAAFLFAAMLAALPALAADSQPVAPVHDVVDEYHGTKVHDPYRWLEKLQDSEVQTWMKGQADYTASTLDRIPIRDEILARLKELDAAREVRVFGIDRLADGRMFYLKQRAEENLAKLYLRGKDGKERLLIDPSTIKPKEGGHVSISFYDPSDDGRLVAYGLAASGSEEDVLHVLDVQSGKDLPDVIDRMEAGYTEPMWLPDGSGFYYARRRLLPADAPETEGYKLTYSVLHRLGTDPDKDERVFAKSLWPNVTMSDEDFPSIVLTSGSPYAIGKIKHGDANQLTLYAARLDQKGEIVSTGGASPWRLICDVPDSVTGFAVHGENIDLVTSRMAPRFKVVRTSLASPSFAKATTVVPAGVMGVDGLSSAHDGLYIQFRRVAAGAIGRIAYEPNAKLEMLELPESFESGRVISAGSQVDGVLIETASWTRPGLTYAFDPKKRSFSDTGLNPRGKYDASAYEAKQVEVKSHDGVMVPLSIIARKNIKLDGSHPTWLTGYGAYAISRSVGFSPSVLAWLERGGVYAVAHVRGGGEYGEAWHLAGQKLTKPNTWKDFIACAEYLIEKGYTRPERLAGQGGSAGGILIGRAITERPDLFGAAVIDVGCEDAVRMEFTRNGVPNIQEFGTVTKPGEFKGLYEMSSYHHVKDGTKYPAVILSHGINDPRVEPWMSSKMAARLQAASASGKPVLLRVDYQAGHGIGSTKIQALSGLADKWAFVLWQMGMVKALP